jgi:hypothetical protein
MQLLIRARWNFGGLSKRAEKDRTIHGQSR